ncbi:hypothetical protein [Sphingobacterium wenxiniae]|uniref:Lipocalin-like domain-containing protein n=1 Tax=Sphingobacterium wenxiniae TaxID=683125 RepID=A0A1I6P501_9SPHI|nr:hypothetical protein [Sphingobacterium wenxiniae]SFS35293.1 hypothetical protein SAMN05660206_101285 [Sphingobacterium wenxiniae]
MKTSIKILSLLFIALFTFASCSKDDDPSDNDLFIGKYEGPISFSSSNEGDTDVPRKDGSVTVTKIGDNYTFNFSDGIPTLSNIEMKKGDNNTLIIGDGALGTITITASTLVIAYTTDGRAWTANCER